jgi:hypothetical protein
MNLQDLLEGLTNPDATTRRNTARVLGMLDETQALEALAAQYRVETASEVKAAVAWAGKRIHEAKTTGYSTLNAIFEYFHISYELDSQVDQHEAELLRKMQHEAEMQMLKERGSKSGSVAAGMLIGGALMGAQGIMMGAMSGLTPGAEVLSSGMEERPQLGKQRTMPTRPGDSDIRMIVRRLQEDPSTEKRRRAAVDLGSISNNPAALPYLAQAFVEDTSPTVKEAAQRAGKLIYWNAIYWEMEQSGAIAEEINRRAKAKDTSATPAAPDASATSHPALRRIQTQESTAVPPPEQAAEPPPPPAPSISLADVLRRAEEAREKRKRK